MLVVEQLLVSDLEMEPGLSELCASFAGPFSVLCYCNPRHCQQVAGASAGGGEV